MKNRVQNSRNLENSRNYVPNWSEVLLFFSKKPYFEFVEDALGKELAHVKAKNSVEVYFLATAGVRELPEKQRTE